MGGQPGLLDEGFFQAGGLEPTERSGHATPGTAAEPWWWRNSGLQAEPFQAPVDHEGGKGRPERAGQHGWVELPQVALHAQATAGLVAAAV